MNKVTNIYSIDYQEKTIKINFSDNEGEWWEKFYNLCKEYSKSREPVLKDDLIKGVK
ncbi:MAG: hypothetical protein GY782_04900 [Gammaproteobacteria bacterium]|nr:hypothetical protein [Gammaproteobacteria bacterium]